MKIKSLLGASLISIILLAGCAEEGTTNNKEADEPKQEVEAAEEVEATNTEEADTTEEEANEGTAIEEEEVEEVEEEPEEEVVVEDYDLGVTPDQLEANFNSTASELGADLNISVIFEEGEVGDTVRANISNAIAFIGSVDKESNMVKDLVLIGSNFKDADESLDYMMAAAMLMSVSDPSLSADERGDIFLNQLSFEDTVSSLTDSSTVVNEREYSLGASQEMGIMFTISNANN